MILLSKHRGDIEASLSCNCIAKNLFSEIITLRLDQEKADYVTENSIFIDDSFSERRKISEKIGIPVFDIDTIETLVDGRR